MRTEVAKKDVAGCKGNKDLLSKLLSQRRFLARIYRDDGAVRTANIVEEVDVAIFEEALTK